MRLSKSQQGMLEKGVVAAAPVEDEHEHDEYQPEPERANVGTPPSSSAPMVEWALYWAEQGWNVFPLRVGAKEPLFPRAHDKGKQADCKGECGRDGHGAYDGTTDRDRIRRWWSKYPRANVGANLGDDRLVFDLDLEHGAVDLPFPATRSHPTGRGGGNRHLIWSTGIRRVRTCWRTRRSRRCSRLRGCRSRRRLGRRRRVSAWSRPVRAGHV
jgi:hypothetical protein